MNGAELWAKRIALGLTPTRLSELIGPNKRSITRWEQRRSEVPRWVADAVNDLYRFRGELIRLVWERYVDDDGEFDTLVLAGHSDEVPDYAPEGTTPTMWNNAVVAVFNEASETTTPRIEWGRYTDGGEDLDEEPDEDDE